VDMWNHTEPLLLRSSVKPMWGRQGVQAESSLGCFGDLQGLNAVSTAVASPITFKKVRAFKGARPQQIL